MAVAMFRPFEPKAKNRFVFYINGIPSYIIKATNLPSQENGEMKIRYLNTSFKVKSLTDWGDLDVTLYDPIEDSGAAAVRNWVMQHHLAIFGLDGYAFGFNPLPTGNSGGVLGQVGEVLGGILGGQVPGGVIGSPLGYKKNIEIKYLDPGGKEIQGWKIFGAYIGNANWGDLDWSQGEALEIKLTIKYDYAQLL